MSLKSAVSVLTSFRITDDLLLFVSLPELEWPFQ